jgi:hypothetical protein
MLIEIKQTTMGMNSGRQTFTYDEHGYKSEEINYFGDESLGNKVIYTRNYDSTGNWTKEIISAISNLNDSSELATLVSETCRTITYYE